MFLLSRAVRTAALTVALGAGVAVPAASARPAAPAPLPVPAGTTEPAVTAADLPRLQGELAQVTTQAQSLADELDQAAARDGGLRVAMDRLADARDAAQARLDARARQVYVHSVPNPFGQLAEELSSPGIRRLTHAGEVAGLTVDRSLIDAVTQQSGEVHALMARSSVFRAGLRLRAAAVLAAQDRARALLATAERLAAQQQAVQDLARLQTERAALDVISSSVTAALSPAVSARGRSAATSQAPVLAALEAAGSGYPAGYGPTGQVLTGTASWYGPGFVGNPTASGAPYDPEQLTCANKEVPLDTVLRVSANGRSVSCLVNDRGPYVGDRVLDMSRAGSRALGYDGLASVVIEVLAPTGA